MNQNKAESKTVLIVEDSPTQALHVQALLEEKGLHIIRAENGRAGLHLARAARPSLIIMDVQMPEMSGLQACQALKADPETADIPIILLTAHDEQATIVRGLKLGAIDFIPKDTFADAMLLETLRQLGLMPQNELNTKPRPD